MLPFGSILVAFQCSFWFTNTICFGLPTIFIADESQQADNKSDDEGLDAQQVLKDKEVTGKTIHYHDEEFTVFISNTGQKTEMHFL